MGRDSVGIGAVMVSGVAGWLAGRITGLLLLRPHREVGWLVGVVEQVVRPGCPHTRGWVGMLRLTSSFAASVKKRRRIWQSMIQLGNTI